MEQHYQNYKGTYENFYYDISTGGTWKGEMEAFVVVTPFEMKSDSTEFEVIDSKVNIYSIKDYKPKPKESLFFERVTDLIFAIVLFFSISPQSHLCSILPSDVRVAFVIIFLICDQEHQHFQF
jgi:hypothetical protein